MHIATDYNLSDCDNRTEAYFCGSISGIHCVADVSDRSISSNKARCSGGTCFPLPTTARPNTSFEPKIAIELKEERKKKNDNNRSWYIHNDTEYMRQRDTETCPMLTK